MSSHHCAMIVKRKPCGQQAAWYLANELTDGYSCNLHLSVTAHYLLADGGDSMVISRMRDEPSQTKYTLPLEDA